MSEKKEWPELVGVNGEEAKKIIQTEDPNLLVPVIPCGSCITMNYNNNRVMLFVDKNGNVVSAPRIG